MKYLLPLLVLFFPLYSISIGNPATPNLIREGFFASDENWWSFRTGAEGVWIYNERYKGDMHNVKMQGGLAHGVFTIHQRVDLYTKMGGAQMSFHREGLDEQKSSCNGFYLAGMRADILEIYDTSFGADVNYNYFSSKAALLIPTRKNPIRHKEWQIGVGLAQKLGVFHPYAGAVFRRAKLTIKNHHGPDERYSSLHHMGAYLGLSLTNNSYAFLNIEGRFYDEAALFLEGEIRF